MTSGAGWQLPACATSPPRSASLTGTKISDKSGAGIEEVFVNAEEGGDYCIQLRSEFFGCHRAP